MAVMASNIIADRFEVFKNETEALITALLELMHIFIESIHPLPPKK
jgi:hypothetical protein